MRIYTKEELKKILDDHQLWLQTRTYVARYFGSGYFVTDSGDLFSCISPGGYGFREHPKKLKPRKMKNGYLQYSVNKKNILAHRLVASCFLGLAIKDRKSVVHHVDGNRTNNHASNLRITTSSENNRLARKVFIKDVLMENGMDIPQRQIVWS